MENDFILGEILNKCGISMGELAEKGVATKATISRMCSGQTSPKYETLKKISEYIGVPVSNFFKSNDDYFTCPHCGRKIYMRKKK